MADSPVKMLTQKSHKTKVFYDTIRLALSIVQYGSAASMGGESPSAHLNSRGSLPITLNMLSEIQKKSIKKDFAAE